MRYFFDTEFDDQTYRGGPIRLISIGVVDENERGFYAETHWRPDAFTDPWLLKNVMPHLQRRINRRKTSAEIGHELKAFVGEDCAQPEFWAWVGAYDWVLLRGLYGSLLDGPAHWPKTFHELKDLHRSCGSPELPKRQAHDALEDARWARNTWIKCASQMPTNL